MPNIQWSDTDSSPFIDGILTTAMQGVHLSCAFTVTRKHLNNLRKFVMCQSTIWHTIAGNKR